MKRALAVFAVPLIFACAGAESPPQTPDNAEPSPAEVAPAANKTDAAVPADGARPEEGAWEGETQAKGASADTGSGKAETRTMEVIQQLVMENRKPVRECFDKAKKELPDLAGDMTIHFVVDPEGKVKKAELNQERSTVKAAPVVDCAIKVLQGIKFPPSSRGMDTTVNYPFNFK